jgi:hypothetical protein
MAGYTSTASVPTISLAGVPVHGFSDVHSNSNSYSTFQGHSLQPTHPWSLPVRSIGSSPRSALFSRSMVRSITAPGPEAITEVLQIWYKNLLDRSVNFGTNQEPTGLKRFSNIMSIFKVSLDTLEMQLRFSDRVKIGRSVDHPPLSISGQDRCGAQANSARAASRRT